MNKQRNQGGYSAVSVQPRDHVVGHVYFLTCDQPDFPVKIGFTADPKLRVMNIEQGLPYRTKVLAIAPGSRVTERAVLRHFKEWRLRGEWFSRSSEIMAAVERVNAGGEILPPPDRPMSPEMKKHLEAVRKMDFSEVRPA